MTGPRNVLVTGAHGFIGRHVARRLARSGDHVTGLGHGNWTPDEWRSWGLEFWFDGDVTSENLSRFAGRPNLIVHCAGSGSVALSIDAPSKDFHRTVTTTVAVMDYVRESSPDTRVVYPSSAGVYGRARNMPIYENSDSKPVSPYGTHKHMAEQIIASYCRQYGVSAAIVRLFSVYGCGLRKQLLWDACRKLYGDDYTFMGTGNEIRDWLHVDDASELLNAASQHASPLCPVANGGTGVGVSVREILTHLSGCLEKDSAQIAFSETPRIGDPSVYIAEITMARSWGWEPGAHWRERVAEYATWWRLEMGMQ